MQLRNHFAVGATAALFLVSGASAQVTYSQNFDAGIAGWTGNFAAFSNATVCGGAGGAVRRKLWSSAQTGQLISPLTGVANGSTQVISYDYKAANWSANTAPAPGNWGSFDVQYGPTATGPWTTFATVSAEAQTGLCLGKSHNFTPPAGDLYIRFSAQWVSGDYYLNFDNVSIQPASGCSGVPMPGNTVASVAGACPGVSFDLSLQNPTAGTGVSYQWYASTAGAGGPFSMVGGNTATYSTSQTVATWYYCDVTCAAGPSTGSSTVLQVPMAAPANPVTFSGGVVNPACWSVETVSGVGLPDWNAASAYGNGSGCVRFDFYLITATNEFALVSPEFAPVAAGTQCYFDVAGATYTGGEADTIVLEESSDGGSNWTTVATMTNEAGVGVLNTAGTSAPSFTPGANQWNDLAYALSGGTNRIRFRGVSDYGNRVYLDNISVGIAPAAVHTPYGSSCASPAMTLSSASQPLPGTTSLLDIGSIPVACPSPAPVFHFGVVVFSLSQDYFGNELTNLGIASPGCDLHVGSIDALVDFVDTVPNQQVSLAIPAGAPLGIEVFSQAAALICPVSPNDAGILLSNGLRTYVNNY